MLKYENSYENREPMQTIAEIIIDYFDNLGEKIAEVLEGSREFGYNIGIPSYANRMREMAELCYNLSGDFNCGRSLKVLQRVTSDTRDGASYKTYFRILCSKMQELDEAYVATNTEESS